MTLKEYAVENGFIQSFKAHHEIGYAYDESLESDSKLHRYNRFLEEAASILKVGKVGYFEGQILTDKKTSKAARERFYWFCQGLSYANYFME